ncbi:prepilin peptidase [Butyrivibrio sp. CB08]|uniref:prepilin peptidase n=1 Tax=Butyrivibrio sp. CB08 TaxID=2364879 RepID=UPI0013146679|nr:prepilin peptidase [Butyrivibrio sp. CB08]
MFFEIGILLILIISSIEDIRKKEILLWEIGTCGIVSVVRVLLDCTSGMFDPGMLALSVLPGAVLLVLALVTRQGIGFGDGLIILSMGPALGAWGIMAAVVTALFASSLFSGTLLILRRAGKKTKIAFMPFLALGSIVTMLGSFGWR